MTWYLNPSEYTTAIHEGREVRLSNTLPARDALLSNPDAMANAVANASRLPFAYTRATGLVMADRIA